MSWRVERFFVPWVDDDKLREIFYGQRVFFTAHVRAIVAYDTELENLLLLPHKFSDGILKRVQKLN